MPCLRCNCDPCVFESWTSLEAVCFWRLEMNNIIIENRVRGKRRQFEVPPCILLFSSDFASLQSTFWFTQSPHTVLLFANYAKPRLILSYIPVSLKLLQPFSLFLFFFFWVVLGLDISVARRNECTKEEEAIKATSLQTGGEPTTINQPARQKLVE